MPEEGRVATADYVPVSSTPRAPPLEFVPPKPRKGAVWVDGSWEWVGTRYGWRYGTWAIVPKGLFRARWAIVRRHEDGQLFFAPASWKDASGRTVDDSAWIHALGPDARARSRIGGPAPFEPPPRPGDNGNAPRDQERKPEDTTTRPAVQEDDTPVGPETR